MSVVLNGYIRYDKLDEILFHFLNSPYVMNEENKSVVSKPGDTVSIYIDINTVYKKSILVNTYNGIDVLNTLMNDYCISLINLIAHYRHYLISRYQYNARIYVINTIPSSIFQQQSVDGEKNTDLFQLAGALIEYIPNTYYIYRPGEYFTAVESSISDDTSIRKIYLSNDPYIYQLIGESEIIDNCAISHNTLVTYHNAIDKWYWRGASRSLDVNDMYPSILPMIMAYSRDPDLQLKSFYNIRKALKIIRQNIADGKILPMYNLPDAIIKVLQKDSIENGEDPDTLYNRYMIADRRAVCLRYLNSPIAMIDTWKNSKSIPFQSFINICDEYFNSIDASKLINSGFLWEMV